MAHIKRVRIIKRIRVSSVWRFISLQKNGARYIWDQREGVYSLEWWEGTKRRREVAGPPPARRGKPSVASSTNWSARPSQAAGRSKRNRKIAQPPPWRKHATLFLGNKSRRQER